MRFGRGRRQVYRVYDDDEYLAADAPAAEAATVESGASETGAVDRGAAERGAVETGVVAATPLSTRTSPRALVALGAVIAATLGVGGLVLAHTKDSPTAARRSDRPIAAQGSPGASVGSVPRAPGAKPGFPWALAPANARAGAAVRLRVAAGPNADRPAGRSTDWLPSAAAANGVASSAPVASGVGSPVPTASGVASPVPVASGVASPAPGPGGVASAPAPTISLPVAPLPRLERQAAREFGFEAG